MIGKVVTTPKPVTLAQVEELLAKRSGEGDFGYEQQKSLEYSKRFAKVSAKKAHELLGQLQEEFGVPYDVAVKIVDVIPKHHSQLRVLIGTAGVSEEKQKKILELLSKVKIKHIEEAKTEEAPAQAVVETAPEEKKEEAKEEGREEKKSAKKEAPEKEEKKASKKDDAKDGEKREKKSKKEKE